MFGMGIVAAQRGWLDPVPDRIRRGCGLAALGGVVAWGRLRATMAATGVDRDAMVELRFHRAPLTLAAIEIRSSSARLSGCSASRNSTASARRARSVAPWRAAPTAPSSSGAAVLIGLMIALQPVGVPAKIKAPAVAGFGVAGSFGLAWLLVTRTRLGPML